MATIAGGVAGAYLPADDACVRPERVPVRTSMRRGLDGLHDKIFAHAFDR